jgi:hypothetical protein
VACKSDEFAIKQYERVRACASCTPVAMSVGSMALRCILTSQPDTHLCLMPKPRHSSSVGRRSSGRYLRSWHVRVSQGLSERRGADRFGEDNVTAQGQDEPTPFGQD